MGLFYSCVHVKANDSSPQSVHEYYGPSKGPTHTEKPEKDSLAAANMAAVVMGDSGCTFAIYNKQNI